MLDTVSVIIGLIIGLVVMLIVSYVLSYTANKKFKLDDPTDDEDYIKNVLNKPKCPDCYCYDLELVDLTTGADWLKGHIVETDFYKCKKCGRVFTDEGWQNAQSFR